MTTSAILTRLTAAGLALEVKDGRLLVKPRSKVTPNLDRLIRRHRDALVESLTDPFADLDRLVLSIRPVSHPVQLVLWDHGGAISASSAVATAGGP